MKEDGIFTTEILQCKCGRLFNRGRQCINHKGSLPFREIFWSKKRGYFAKGASDDAFSALLFFSGTLLRKKISEESWGAVKKISTWRKELIVRWRNWQPHLPVSKTRVSESSS